MNESISDAMPALSAGVGRYFLATVRWRSAVISKRYNTFRVARGSASTPKPKATTPSATQSRPSGLRPMLRRHAFASADHIDSPIEGPEQALASPAKRMFGVAATPILSL